jgi:capsule polysaccharide export protein KpsC/LpsZ
MADIYHPGAFSVSLLLWKTKVLKTYFQFESPQASVWEKKKVSVPYLKKKNSLIVFPYL